MATLHVRNVPGDLYARLHEFASTDSQSLAAEVTALLTQAVEERELRSRQRVVLASLRRRRFTPPPEALDSSELLREDRER